MKELKKRKLFKNATDYKIVWMDCSDMSLHEKEFRTTKSLEQFYSRNSTVFAFMLINKFALVDGEWHPYIIIGNRTLLINELEYILNELKDESMYKWRGAKTLKSKKVKNYNTQKKEE